MLHIKKEEKKIRYRTHACMIKLAYLRMDKNQVFAQFAFVRRMDDRWNSVRKIEIAVSWRDLRQARQAYT